MLKLHILTTTFAFFIIAGLIFRNEPKTFSDLVSSTIFMVLAFVGKEKVNFK